MKKLVKRTKHPRLRRVLIRAAAVLLAVLLGGGVWLAVDPGARAAFLSWFRETHESYFLYRHQGGSNDALPSLYLPTWIPEGYTEFHVDEPKTGHDLIMVDYINKDDQFLSLVYLLDPDGYTCSIDISHATESDITINGCPAKLFVSTTGNQNAGIMWTTENGSYFYIDGFMEPDNLIRVAESVQEIKK